MEFSHDGRLLTTAVIGGDARIWNVADGRAIHILNRPKGRVARVAFAPDGKRIVTASDDHTVRIYTCALCGSVYELVRLAHQQLVHISALLTVGERKRYLGG